MTSLETTRLAQELHDGIAQDLVGLGYALDLIMSNSTTSIETRIELRKIRLDVSELLERTRLEIHDLHQIETSDLFAQIRSAVDSIPHSHSIEVDVPPSAPLLPEESIYQVLRIVREALRNIVQHAKATRIKISAVVTQTSLQISIVDNGSGHQESDEKSFGLLGATKRAEALGGSLVFGPTGTGFDVTLRIPIPSNGI
jgi:NarL family two-component system sensor histidine kinase LiaS